MSQSQASSASQSSSAVRGIPAYYAMPAADRQRAADFSQRPAVPMRSGENAAVASMDTSVAWYFYYGLLQEENVRARERRRAEEERWEQLAMEMGVEKDIVFKTPNLPKRRITVKLRYRGRAIPKFYYEPVEDDE